MTPANLELRLVPEGRQIIFSEQAGQRARIYRRVAGKSLAWQQVAQNARSPFVDGEGFVAGTTLEYHVQHFTQHDEYERHSHIVPVRLT